MLGAGLAGAPKPAGGAAPPISQPPVAPAPNVGGGAAPSPMVGNELMNQQPFKPFKSSVDMPGDGLLAEYMKSRGGFLG